MDSRIREDIVDRGIEKGEWEMRNLSKQLHQDQYNRERRVSTSANHHSGHSEQSDSSKDDVRNRKVDPEAVRESFKEAELDPIAENEPEEGEKAA